MGHEKVGIVIILSHDGERKPISEGHPVRRGQFYFVSFQTFIHRSIQYGMVPYTIQHYVHSV